ncbi:PepSY-associated TM helix domain-containing protein [Membranihabitans marinus]|uniref:PepSY-associated TM helix domain-containing protein n=1 Tax=Membranihabitans marinus TaxID=1227546 RepID=UPI001F16650F|nr:PepSY-associated TM helix domain-containing protein [Membranihabitans marinus]
MSNRRIYNVLFNTHTVSGIVISAALYVIFFAGAFSLFKAEIAIWENGNPVSHTERKDIDFDHIIQNLDQNIDLTSRDLQFNFGEHDDKIEVFIDRRKDSTLSETAQETHFFSIEIHSSEGKTYEQHYSVGEFLYRLHFFSQFPAIGIYLAGFVSLFFLFAIITGIIVHWKKIIPNFYTFNPRIALKRVWTEAHTALGVIGLPFQLMFALTGAYFCLSLLVLIPANFLYDGDQLQLMEDVRPDRKVYEWLGESNNTIPSFNEFAQLTASQWDNFDLTRGFIRNYAGVNMKYILVGDLEDSEGFIGIGRLVINPYTGDIESYKNPKEGSYIEDIQRVLGRLHFADFGGIPMKLLYFILSLLTCFVIISGVLIWIESRNKRSMTLTQRLYTAKVGHIYMAICLSMLPVTALAFLFVKLSNGYFENKMSAIYWFYFLTWLGFILFFRFKRDNYFTNKYCLLLGGIFGLFIPVANGIITKNWLWTAFSTHQFEIFFIDLFWIGIAISSLVVYSKLKPSIKDQSSFSKNPIDYNHLKNEEISTPSRTSELNDLISTDKNHIDMRTKIIILWIFLGIGWIIHHIYGLFNIYYNETLIIEGATGEPPFMHHIYRILFEGLCLTFALLTVEISKQWFKWLSLIWASIAGLYNIYHFVEALFFESSNISEIFMLALVTTASIFLIRNIFLWKK